MISREAIAAWPQKAGKAVAAATRWVIRLFGRSLQLRVIAATIVLTCLGLYGVGAYMAQQIARNLHDNKLGSLSGQTLSYARHLEQLSPSTQSSQSDLTEQLRRELRSMLSSSPIQLRAIVLEPTPESLGVRQVSVQAADQPEIAQDVLTEALTDTVRESGGSAQAYQAITLPGPDGRDLPGLAVGQQISIPGAGQFELYVLADLRDEARILGFVHRSMIVGAVVLVVLVGAISWTVARLVVNPVRVAAEVSQRIASGDLDQRMPVRGHDEIATLGRSFNDMAENLQNHITRMEQLSEVQRQFVSDVSHELRTPLATIKMAAEMVHQSRDEFDPAAARSAELLHSQVDRFERLLSDLLEISRFDAGAAQLETRPEDLKDLVERVVETVEMLAEQTGSQIRVHAPSGPVMTDLDPVRIQRVVRNLVVNAIEHGEGKPVDVYVAADANASAVSVRDHGVGLSAEAVEHVFDRFWRADPARRRTLGGSGLGLAISLEDAHLHGGWLQAWGRPDEGACFRLTLPRRAGAEIASSPLPLPPADAVLRRGQAELVAGPVSSDGSVRLHTGSIPLIVEREAMDNMQDAIAADPASPVPPLETGSENTAEDGGGSAPPTDGADPASTADPARTAEGDR